MTEEKSGITDPTTFGFSTEGLKRMDAVMLDYVERGQLAGVATVLVRNGKTVHVGLHGDMDLRAGKPMQEDTIFRIFSMTKPITSLAVLMLLEEGHFSLETPIADFMPEFKQMQVLVHQTEEGMMIEPLERAITIFDLLTHTSGMGYGLEGSTPVEAMCQQAALLRMDECLADKVQRIASIPLHHQPGERYTYSFGTDLLGGMVEIISGMPLDRFFQQRIFDPLGMVDTDFYVSPEKLDRLAALYTTGLDGRLLDLADFPGDPTQFPFGLWTDKSQKPAFLSGGGGLVSTADDYLRFARLLANKGEVDGVRLIKPEMVELMLAPHLSSEKLNIPGAAYGLGVLVLTDPIQAQIPGSPGSYAAGGAAHTDFWYEPVQDLTGLLMTQYIHYNALNIPHEFKILAHGALTA
jgi:CubicO group peptidase (beta-lactamase class C family)